MPLIRPDVTDKISSVLNSESPHIKLDVVYGIYAHKPVFLLL
jgi:hypothetical protein